MGLFDLFSDQPAKDAAQARIAGYTGAYNQASGLYSQGRDALNQNFGQGINTFTNLLGSDQPGANAYGDATGANGAAGLGRAQALFTATPGYTEGLNQTLDQNDRRAASRGMLASGNTDADTAKLATDYANQKYGSYVAGLQPYLGAQTSAATGLGGLYSGLGTALNTNLGQQASAAYGTQQGIGDANAAADLAKYQASGNLWSTLIGGAGALGKLGGSGGLGGLFSSFGPGQSGAASG